MAQRVILHVDLDVRISRDPLRAALATFSWFRPCLQAFYCQVEMKRCGIPAHVPCAVQQWEGLIAVNYPARTAGVTRHMRAPEARVKCPELQCVHVETIGKAQRLTQQFWLAVVLLLALAGGPVRWHITASQMLPGC